MSQLLFLAFLLIISLLGILLMLGGPRGHRHEDQVGEVPNQPFPAHAAELQPSQAAASAESRKDRDRTVAAHR